MIGRRRDNKLRVLGVVDERIGRVAYAARDADRIAVAEVLRVRRVGIADVNDIGNGGRPEKAHRSTDR